MRLLTSSIGHTLSVRKRMGYRVESWEFVLGSLSKYRLGQDSDRYETTYTREEAVRLHRNLGIMLKATAPPKRKAAK